MNPGHCHGRFLYTIGKSGTVYSANFGMTWRDFAKAGNKEFIMMDNSVYLDGKGYLEKDNTLVNPDDYIYIDAYYVY